MAIETVVWATRYSPLEGVDLLVHLALADHADATRGDRIDANPLYIAAQCRTTPGQVHSTVARLASMGYLSPLAGGSNDRIVARLLRPSDAPIAFDSLVHAAGVTDVS